MAFRKENERSSSSWGTGLAAVGGLALLGIAYNYRHEIKSLFENVLDTQNTRENLHLSTSRFDGREMTECCICLAPLSEFKVDRLPCNHCFHQKCIDEVFKNEDCEHKCPLCRRPAHC